MWRLQKKHCRHTQIREACSPNDGPGSSFTIKAGLGQANHCEHFHSLSEDIADYQLNYSIARTGIA